VSAESLEIEAVLANHANKDLLRLITCGSVDDGKSTLIGRLLFDSKQIFEDQLASVERDSKKWGTTGDQADLALLSMACSPSESRASPSMWPIGFSPHRAENTSSPTRQAMNNTHAIWPPVHPPPIWRSF